MKENAINDLILVAAFIGIPCAMAAVIRISDGIIARSIMRDIMDYNREHPDQPVDVSFKTK